jgi:hypothetical protein
MKESAELALKGRVAPATAVDLFQLNQGRHQGLGHVTPTVGAKVAKAIRQSLHE